jgi:hypothetical protein
MTTLTEILNNPEEHYPGNFDTPERANALLTGLCQDAATEIERLKAAQPDYAWPTVQDYEADVGLKVNDAFRSAWAMARTTNDLFDQMGSDT